MYSGVGMEGYSGSDSYLAVESLINGPSRRLMISSPYIDLFYAEMLISAARKKEIFLLTTNSSINKKALLKISRGAYGIMPKVAAYFLILLAISAVLRLWYATAAIFFLSLFPLARIYVVYKRRERTPHNLKVKIARGRFLHEKIYISEKIAIVGSANLTFRGMHRNIEHIETILDPQRIGELRSHFEGMWKNRKMSKNL
jgi:phosphatidylserine/phosphatidylglycerophosphate/cardiolipin synthase-like enzyme